MSDSRQVSTDYLLRRVARARAAGDVGPARPEWEICVVRATARVRAVVGAYRAPGGDRIPLADRDAVVYAALERAIRRMINTLDKFNERSFSAAMARCAERACQDYIRSVGAYERGLGGSLDEPAFEDATGGRYDQVVARLSAEQARADEDTRGAAERLEDALGRMSNPRRREAVELRCDGHATEEIADRLGVSVDNAYQLVSRGLRDLRGLMQ